ncbi:type II toxin-antitoxin system VapC family toxin [Acidobacteria bacterium AH-259-L09]|nr:type II toxin-antitoxin system VapC family toxin [Acidobacteria bacterium AH-259-L09]
MIYFDAAYISKCYLHEPGTEKVIALAGKSDGLCSSHYGRLEFFSVLHRHLREGHLSRRQIAKVLNNFQQDERDDVWYWLPVTSPLVEQICSRVRTLPKTAFLRAGDALDLGTASENGFREVYTNDRHMLACTKYFDLIGKNVL